MIEFDVILVTAAVALLCLADWRTGVLATLAMGFALDPMRKLVPGEPLYFSGLVFVLVAATLAGMRLRGIPLTLRPIFAWSPVLRVPLFLFLLLVVVQSAAAYARTGRPVIAVIGLIAYLAPLPGVLLGYAWSRSTADVTRAVRWYVGCVAVMAAGIYLARVGYDWAVLDAVGVGLFAFSPTGGRLDLASGFFRTPEVAAWHVAMATCFVVLLFLSRRGLLSRLGPTTALGLYFLVALLFTGRRKGIVEIGIFVLGFLVMIAWFQRRAFKTALLLGVISLAGIGAFTVLELGGALGIAEYYERGTNLGMTEVERYGRMTVLSLEHVIRRNGWLGAGAGTGSQGAQYFGGGADLVGRSAEGGIGKVVAELGVPGLVVLALLAGALGYHLWTVIRVASRYGHGRAHYAYGLTAFLIANAVLFAVAHQIFGDPLVLFVIGFFLGAALAVPHMRPAGSVSSTRQPAHEAAVPVGQPR